MKKSVLILIMFLGLTAFMSPVANAQQPCSAGFQYVIGTVTPNGAQVTFYDSSFTVGTITSWSWSFGNGTGSTMQNPVGSLNPGNNYVCLTITAVYQNQTCTDTYCDTIFIGSQPPVCNATFTYVISPLGVTLSAATGSNVSWTWDFGDGTAGTGSNATHVYTAPGNYTVCLTVLDASGVTCTSCQTITISTSAGCQAYFTWASVGGTTIIDFTNQSQGNATYFSWSFGDGTSSSLENPSHTYNSTGNFTVCLTITDSVAGCSDTYCDSVTVGGSVLCDPSFTVQNSPQATIFVANAMTNVTWAWDFGDGVVSTQGPTVNHVYVNPGTYTACLTVTTSNGNSCTSCDTVVISNSTGCSSNFAIYPDSITPHTYYAYNLASGVAPLTYIWSWGDGTSSTGAYPSHTYSGPGLYTICLTITDASGCSSNTCYQWQLLRLSSSAPVTINVIPGTTGITEPETINAVSVFPNPASDMVTASFSVTKETPVTISVLNMSGQKVFEVPAASYASGNHQVLLDASTLAKGMYVIEFRSDAFTKHSKISIQ